MSSICAYYNPKEGVCHDLGLHSLRVASFIAIQFNNRLQTQSGPIKIVTDKICGKSCTPLKLAILSGLMHDIGKASNFYQSRPEKGFSFHEHVSAIIISKAAEISMEYGDEETARMLELIASIVARHHVAMPDHHPDEVYRIITGERRQYWNYGPRRPPTSARLVERLSNAIRGLEPDIIVRVGIDRFLPETASDYITEAIRELNNNNYKTIRKFLTRTITRNIAGLNPKIGYKILKFIQVITGTLIVSDILVAWRERGSGDPGRVYAVSWLNELKANTLLDDIVSRKRLEEYAYLNRFSD